MTEQSARDALVTQWRAVAICILVSIGAFQFGYDSSYFSGILAMEPFLEIYGHYDTAQGSYVLSSRLESIVTSIINVGELLGALSSYLVGDFLGRRGGLFLAMVAVVIGVIFQVSANNLGLLITGRLILGFAVGIISCMVPLYLADCAPTRFRGALVSLYQQCIGLGLLLGIIVDYSTKNRADYGSFRIPMTVQLIFPIILVPTLLFLAPESPRWLVEKGKHAQARAALARLNNNNPDSVNREMSAIQSAVGLEERDKTASWLDLFKWGPEGRKAYLGFALQALQQASGINFITSYGVVFFTDIGITNSFLIQVGLYCVGFPTIVASQFFVERFGRRPVLLLSGILNSIVLLIVGGCGVATDKTLSLEKVIVGMVYVFMVVFNFGWGPTVWVVTSEISTGKNRGRLMALSTSSNWLFTWLVSFTFPYLYNPDGAGLGAKIGFLYGALMIVAQVWVFFYLPETSGRSLEDIDYLFKNQVPAREFQSHVIVRPNDLDDVNKDEKNAAQVEIEKVSHTKICGDATRHDSSGRTRS